jgi:hypothetical protein
VIAILTVLPGGILGALAIDVKRIIFVRTVPRNLGRLSVLPENDGKGNTGGENAFGAAGTMTNLGSSTPADPGYPVLYQNVRSKIIAQDRLEELKKCIGTVRVLWVEQANELLALFGDEGDASEISMQAFDLIEPKILQSERGNGFGGVPSSGTFSSTNSEQSPRSAGIPMRPTPSEFCTGAS